MNRKTILVLLIAAISAKSWLSYTIVDKQKQIEQLQKQLLHEQFKYKMLYRDPMVKNAIESGG